jgi:phosphoribosylanthranilate isomerase
MTRVKICGCMRVGDAVAAAEAGADFAGIMFAAESRRRVSVEEASLIVAALGRPLRDLDQDDPPPLHPPPAGGVDEWFAHGAEALDRLLARKRPLTVGVFADQPIEQVNEIADEVGLDLIQLSGDEPWDDCLLANRQVVKALRPRPGMSAADVLGYARPGFAIALMFDPSRGSGREGDRGVAREVAARMPVWLAGGLTPGSVAGAVREVRPWAVDVSTGVETDCVKDAAKIAAFVASAKRVQV